MKAVLMLEDGTEFMGESFGAEGEIAGEVIFNTQVVGFQEILTDPAYQGKIIAIGYPHVGNVGINDSGYESDAVHAQALAVKEYSKVYSHWQAQGSLEDFMKKNKVIGIEGIDTRALTIHIRDHGEMKGIVSTKDFEKASLVKKAKAYEAQKFEIRNSKLEIPTFPCGKSGSRSSEASIGTNPKSKITIINLGVNNSTLVKFPGARVVPADASAEKILKDEPEQVVISSGPGDPAKLTALIEEVKKLVGRVPLYGIQNGACVLALALGCSVYRLKVGHHGVNHPVVDPNTGKGEISVQNHSFGIGQLSENVRVVQVNLNDKSIEKFQSRDGSCVGTLYFPIDERGKLDPGYKYV